MIERVARSGLIVVVCAGAWLLMHGDWSFANLLWGVVLGVGLAVVFPTHQSSTVRHRLHPWALIKLVGFVLWSLVLSSWAVVRTILRPTPENLAAGIVRIRLAEESPLTATLVANAITLTPGTMTLTARLDPAELHVHGIGLADLDQFRATVADLERRTVAALEPLHPEEPA